MPSLVTCRHCGQSFDVAHASGAQLCPQCLAPLDVAGDVPLPPLPGPVLPAQTQTHRDLRIVTIVVLLLPLFVIVPIVKSVGLATGTRGMNHFIALFVLAIITAFVIFAASDPTSPRARALSKVLLAIGSAISILAALLMIVIGVGLLLLLGLCFGVIPLK